MKSPGVRLREMRIIPIRFASEISAGDSLADKLLEACRLARVRPLQGDILVLKHKIVSKAEGRSVELDKIEPSAESKQWARQFHLDARVTELALREGRRVVR